MRFLVWLLVVVSVFWGGYWFVGSRTVEKAAISALKKANNSGHSIEYSSLNTTGFPNRFDTTLTNIDVFTVAGLRWKTSFFQIFALSYRPNHIIAVWPREQVIEYRGDRAVITSTDLRASLVVKPRSSLELDRFQLTGSNLNIVLNDDETFLFEDVSVATRQGTAPLSHDVSVQMSDILVPSPLEASNAISVDSVVLDANLALDAPIGRGHNPANLVALTLNKVALKKGSIGFSVSGALDFNQEGYASGPLTLTANNWEEGFLMLREFGAIPNQHSNTIKTVLKGLAASGGSSSDIQVPLSVKNGNVSLGFIPLGVIPKI